MATARRRADVLILGAGPAGLATAYELKRREIDYLVLEGGSNMAQSWVDMPTHLKLVSPWKANHLPGSDARRFPANREITRADYAAALHDYAQAHELEVQTGVRVHEVAQAAGTGFQLHTAAGPFQARMVINATGCFANPYLPVFPGASESPLPQFHFATYRNAQWLRAATGTDRPRILIVGKQLSAGQLVVELTAAGFEVALACRGPIQFGADELGAWLFFRIHPSLERLRLWWGGKKARGFPPVMPGGAARRLIASGRVHVFPNIARLEGRRVDFVDGRCWEPHALIYATGFRPALAHLDPLGLVLDEHTGRPRLCGFESEDRPGLFFVGLDQLRNFRSRFLRGIREDAPLLAAQISSRLSALSLNRPGQATPLVA
jgi:putative flavoprotein involved in K+ transport